MSYEIRSVSMDRVTNCYLSAILFHYIELYYIISLHYTEWGTHLRFFPHFYRFGVEVIEIVASWTKSLCIEFSQGHIPNHINDAKCGNGLLLRVLAKEGYCLKISSY